MEFKKLIPKGESFPPKGRPIRKLRTTSPRESLSPQGGRPTRGIHKAISNTVSNTHISAKIYNPPLVPWPLLKLEIFAHRVRKSKSFTSHTRYQHIRKSGEANKVNENMPYPQSALGVHSRRSLNVRRGSCRLKVCRPGRLRNRAGDTFVHSRRAGRCQKGGSAGFL
jgi:hypothetical protein